MESNTQKMFLVLTIIACEWGTSSSQYPEHYTCTGQSMC